MRVSLCLLMTIRLPLVSTQRGVRHHHHRQRRQQKDGTPSKGGDVVEDSDPDGTPSIFGLDLLPDASGGDKDEEEAPPETDPFLGFVADALADELGGALGDALGDEELGEYLGDQLGDALGTPEGQKVFGDVLNNPLLGNVLESDLFGDSLVEYLIQAQLENAVESSGGTTTLEGTVIFPDAGGEVTFGEDSLGVSDMPSLVPSDMPSEMPSDAPSSAPSTIITLPTIGGARRAQRLAQRRRALKETDEGPKPEMGTPKGFFDLIEKAEEAKSSKGVVAPDGAEEAKSSKGVEPDGVEFVEEGFLSSAAPSLVPSDAPSIVPSDAPSIVPSDAPSAVPVSVPAPTLYDSQRRQQRRRLKESDEGTKLLRNAASKQRDLKGSKSSSGARVMSDGFVQAAAEYGSPKSRKGDSSNEFATSDASTIQGDSIVAEYGSPKSKKGDSSDEFTTTDASTIQGDSIVADAAPTTGPSFSAMPTISAAPSSSAVPTFSDAPNAAPTFSVAPSVSQLPTFTPVSTKAPKKEKNNDKKRRLKENTGATLPAGPPLAGTESVSYDSADDGPEDTSMIMVKRRLKGMKGAEEKIVATAGAPTGPPLIGPDDLSSLVGPDDLSSLVGPDDLSSLVGPDDLSSLVGPDDLSKITDFIEPLLGPGAQSMIVDLIEMWSHLLVNGDSSGADSGSDLLINSDSIGAASSASTKAPKKEKSDKKRRLMEKTGKMAGAPAGPPLIGTESVSPKSADAGPEAASLIMDKRRLDFLEIIEPLVGPEASDLIMDIIEQGSIWGDSLINGDDSSEASTFSDAQSPVPSDAPSMVPSDAPSSVPSLVPSPKPGRRRRHLEKDRSE